MGRTGMAGPEGGDEDGPDTTSGAAQGGRLEPGDGGDAAAAQGHQHDDGGRLRPSDIVPVVCRPGGGPVLFRDALGPGPVDTDTFVLSKGHAAPILWAALAEAGAAAMEPLSSLRRFDGVKGLSGRSIPGRDRSRCGSFQRILP